MLFLCSFRFGFGVSYGLVLLLFCGCSLLPLFLLRRFSLFFFTFRSAGHGVFAIFFCLILRLACFFLLSLIPPFLFFLPLIYILSPLFPSSLPPTSPLAPTHTHTLPHPLTHPPTPSHALSHTLPHTLPRSPHNDYSSARHCIEELAPWLGRAGCGRRGTVVVGSRQAV